jgi:hypothetical protein
MKGKLLLTLHIAVLFIVLAAAVGVFLLFSGNPAIQFYVVVVATAAYLVWSLVYHFLDKSLTKRLLLEYSLVGVLVLLLYSWTLFG